MMEDAALAEIILGAQRGEAAAFDRLVDLFASRVAGFLFRMTASRQESEDLAQEVFLRLVRMIGAYKHDGRFEPWLFRIAANLVRDRVRRSRRAPSFVADQFGRSDEGRNNRLGLVAASRDSGVDSRLILNEDLCDLDAALAQLAEAEREVVLLRHFSEMSFKEIAELLGVPLGTALARGHRGLTHLREMMVKSSPINEGVNHRARSA